MEPRKTTRSRAQPHPARSLRPYRRGAIAGTAWVWLLASACVGRDGAGARPPSGDVADPYLGQAPPGVVAELFGPGTLSTGLHDDGPALFTPDGNEVYFRKYALPHDAVGVMTRGRTGWSETEMFRPFGAYLMIPLGFDASGGTGFFLSRAPRSGTGPTADYDVWWAARGDDGWEGFAPLDGGLNTEADEYAHSVSGDGSVYLYAPGGRSGSWDLYVSHPADGRYPPRVPLEGLVNTPDDEYAPAISPDGRYLVFGRHGDLLVSFRRDDGTWGPGLDLGPGVNSETTDKFAAVSPDGRFLFFVSHRTRTRVHVFSERSYDEVLAENLGPMNGQGDVYWVSTEAIDRLRP